MLRLSVHYTGMKKHWGPQTVVVVPVGDSLTEFGTTESYEVWMGFSSKLFCTFFLYESLDES